MTTRKRANWPKKLAAAREALEPLRPRPHKGDPTRWALRDRDGTWRDDAGNVIDGAPFQTHVVAHAGAVSGIPKRVCRLAAEKSQETYVRRAATIAAFVHAGNAELLQKPIREARMRELLSTDLQADGFIKFLRREPDKVREMIWAASKK